MAFTIQGSEYFFSATWKDGKRTDCVTEGINSFCASTVSDCKLRPQWEM